MSTVDPEGKWKWYLQCEYGVITILSYLNLGFSLGAAQTRRSFVGSRLAFRDAKRYFCDGDRTNLWSSSMAGCERGQERVFVSNGNSNGECPNPLQLTGSVSPCRDAYGDLCFRFLRQILMEHDTLVGITHGEAVDVKLLNLFMKQANAVRKRQALREALGVRLSDEEKHNEEALFVLADTDSTYARAVAEGWPVSLSYSDAVRLTYLLSDAIAWESFLIHCGSSASQGDNVQATGKVSAKKLRGVPTITRPDCVALMMGNSMEYNPIWIACARSGTTKTFLSELYDSAVWRSADDDDNAHSNSKERPRSEPSAEYYPCTTALINTNITTNAMMYHALECAGASIIIMEPRYVPLLFADDQMTMADEGAWRHAGPPRLNIPPSVRRVFVWRSGGGGGDDAVCTSVGMTPHMRVALDAFNHQVYVQLGRSDKGHFMGSFATATPSLDLFDLVRDLYENQRAPAQAREENPHAHLTRCIIRTLPTWLVQRDARPGKRVVHALRGFAAGVTDGAPSREPNARKQLSRALGREQRHLYKRLSAALSCFQHVQPVLFIYTSGTTGLPKAARFSHLRFFATAFLSKVLDVRGKTAHTLQIQQREREMAAAGAEPDPPKTALDVIVMMIIGIFMFLVHMFLRVIGLGRKRTYSAEELQLERQLSLLTVYNCLPMYHTVGCVFCLGHLMRALNEQQGRCSEQVSKEPYFYRNPLKLVSMPVPSVRMVVRTKFSASRLRADLQQYQVTVMQYIGEILRYAVLYERVHSHRFVTQKATTAALKEKQHQLLQDEGHSSLAAKSERGALLEANLTSWRVPYLFGNGLRLDIWQECIERLNAAQPVEFYSSTEGNIFLFNLFGIPGVVGHIPRFPGPLQVLNMQYFVIFPFKVLRFDEETQQVWRDPKSGFCRRTGVGEVGEVVGEIIQGFDMFALRRFDGYHNSQQNGSGAAERSKVIRHVLWPFASDAFFLSGDLMKFDQTGFCSFVDRIGDTFRWKGENVSTLEVSSAMNTIHTARVGVREAVVYGVTIGGREGRAGMALVTLQRRHQRNGQQRVKERSPAALVEGTHEDAVSLDEEMQFLLNDLHKFLSGAVKHNGDGTVSQAALPPYAIPLFIRINTHPLDVEDNLEPSATQKSQSTPSQVAPTGPTNNSTTNDMHTTTFKYKKSLLMKEGYSVALSSGVPDVGVGAAQQSPVRVYVLVTKPALLERWCPVAVTPGTRAGYVPLTSESLAALGDNFEKCGW